MRAGGFVGWPAANMEVEHGLLEDNFPLLTLHFHDCFRKARWRNNEKQMVDDGGGLCQKPIHTSRRAGVDREVLGHVSPYN